ncbi:MAG TPA: hypothetical protein IGS53_02980 [Leptolyngbyaceae cyanobacterium M33_DOE_097]|uniref:Uncharacterized protein n=1 Tax=Oscillatoriales cyanobacterium SpSt-418 TaxID=2282169 RepID=A0A7C3KJR1_9CYAN|nr:hypothetical protein [Leptolyngbyaceae cyanobacterium M33_DOE_097]
MPQTRSRGTRASVVKPEVMGQVAGFLDELPDKPKEQLSLKEAIAQLHEPIQAAFDKGYSYDETADILRDHGIQISAFTLKSYVPRGRKPSTGKKTTTTRKPRKSAEPSQVEDQTPELVEAAPVQEPAETAEAAPATPRRGAPRGARSKSSTTAQTKTRKAASADEAAPARKSGTRTRK